MAAIAVTAKNHWAGALSFVALIPVIMACVIYAGYLFNDSAKSRSQLPKAVWLNFITAGVGQTIRYLADQNIFPTHTSTLDAAGDVLNG